MKKLSKFAVAAALAALWTTQASAAFINVPNWNGALNDATTGMYAGTYNSATLDGTALSTGGFLNGMSGPFVLTWIMDFSGGSISSTMAMNPQGSIGNMSVVLRELKASVPFACNVIGAFCAIPAAAPGATIATATPANPILSSTFGFTPAVMGRYALVVSGNVTNVNGQSRISGDVSTSAVPEPGSLALVGAALLGLAFTARKRKQG